MSRSVWVRRFQPYSVPVCVSALVAVSILLVPPLVLDLTVRTYALTAAVLILATAAVFPYAILVAVGTLPLLYAGLGSYAPPQVVPAHLESPTTTAVLRHVGAGISYVLAAAAVGAIGIGVDFATPRAASTLPEILRPSFLITGGALVGGTFAGLQLWRYDTPVSALNGRSVLGTVILGGLIALSPVVALWLFEVTIG